MLQKLPVPGRENNLQPHESSYKFVKCVEEHRLIGLKFVTEKELELSLSSGTFWA